MRVAETEDFSSKDTIKLAEPFLQELDKHGKNVSRTVKMPFKCATGCESPVTERFVGAVDSMSAKQKSLLDWAVKYQFVDAPKNTRKRRAS